MTRRKTHEEYVRELIDKAIEIVPLESYKERNKKIKHRCVCGNEWLIRPYEVLRGTRCGCRPKGLKAKTHKEYVEELKSKGIEVVPLEKYKGSKISILHRCECGNEWLTQPANLLSGKRCGCVHRKAIESRRLTTDDYLKSLEEKNIKVKPLEPYYNYSTKIKHQCECGETWIVRPSDVLRNHKCKKCNPSRKKTHKEYLEQLQELNIKVVPLEKYVGTDIKIKHRCVCGCEWSIPPQDILKGQKCMNCRLKKRTKTHEQYLKELKQLGIKTIPLEKYKKMKVEIKHRCVCGTVFSSQPIYVLRGFKCGCETSKGENIIKDYLKENNYEYGTQQTFAGFKSPKDGLFKYDISILKNGRVLVLIEYHGKQHFEYNSFFYREGIKEFHYRQLCDQMKRDYATKKGIPLIELTYKDKDPIGTLEKELKALGIGATKERKYEQMSLF